MTTSAAPAPHPRIVLPAALAWEDGVPVSRTYRDIYFSRHDGIAESRAVFLDGNGLPGRWQAHDSDAFCIGELGFGTGLNFLLTRAAFLAHARSTTRLHFVSFERHPLLDADWQKMAAVLADRNPALGAAMSMLAGAAPPRLEGWHRLVFDHGRVRLSLYLGDAADGLADWAAAAVDHGTAADAWFLDGFAPQRNPELWSPALFDRLAGVSRPAATLATFSVAAEVRRGLTDAGFRVERVPGPPGKRQVLRGHLANGGRPPRPLPGSAHVIGAGLAGASAAAALAERGVAVVLHDPAGAATAASANPWAVLQPRLPLDDGPRGPFLAGAYHFTGRWLAALPATAGWQPRPVLQLPEARRPERLQRVLACYGASGAWLEPGRLGELEGILFPAAGHAALPSLIALLLRQHAAGVSLADTHVSGLARSSDGWHLLDAAGGRTAAADRVVVAAAAASADLLPDPAPLGRMRGQITRTRWAEAIAAPALPILTGRGHAFTVGDGWVCGASYVKDGGAGEPSAREREENLARLAHLRSLLAAAGTLLPEGAVVAEFAGERCTVTDRAPLIGMSDAGLGVSTGHASAGLLTCPLAGEAIAAAACGEPPVFDREIARMLDPQRFGR